MAKRELIPAKQEKAFERVKGFRSELVEFRQQFERLKAEKDETVGCTYLLDDNGLTNLTTCLANNHQSYRAPRPPSPPRLYPGKPQQYPLPKLQLRLPPAPPTARLLRRCPI